MELTDEAEQATKEGSGGRCQDILLSSAAIPLAFPARKIDGKVYADGGVIGNVLMGRDPEWVVKMAKTWKERHPDGPMPKVRMWVLVNIKARMDPQFFGTNWMPVAARSVVASTHASTVQAIQQMWLRYRLAAVQTGAQSEFYWCAIPDDFDVPAAGRPRACTDSDRGHGRANALPAPGGQRDSRHRAAAGVPGVETSRETRGRAG